MTTLATNLFHLESQLRGDIEQLTRQIEQLTQKRDHAQAQLKSVQDVQSIQAQKSEPATPSEVPEPAREESKKLRKAQAKADSTEAAVRGKRDVADGKRPKFKDAIALVIGARQMSASEVFSGLQGKGWVPNSSKPKDYVSFTLSREKDYFEKVSRGIYRVKKGIIDSIKTELEAPPKLELDANQVDECLRNDFGLGDGSQAQGNPFPV